MAPYCIISGTDQLLLLNGERKSKTHLEELIKEPIKTSGASLFKRYPGKISFSISPHILLGQPVNLASIESEKVSDYPKNQTNSILFLLNRKIDT